MLKLFSKPSFLLSLLAFLFLILPKHSYNPKKETHTENYNENLFLEKPNIPESHKAFLLQLIPLIQHSNQSVLNERERLLKIKKLVEEGKKINQPEQRWLKSLEIKYQGKTKKESEKLSKAKLLVHLEELLSRVDMIPIRFALAQAAIESGWGKSRFCIEGNAYFGIHCYKPGCGIKARENQLGGFQVKAYESIQASVDDYFLFLNSKRSMRRFRKERNKYFHEQSSNLIKLAGSIKNYSGIGENYQLMIGSILRIYIPKGIANS